jgi:RimJ/RimL family protein N-acetyltransferase
MRTIYTKQLLLRPLAPHDKDMFCQLYTSQITMAFIAPQYSHKNASNSFNSASNFNKNNERIIKTWAVELNNADDILQVTKSKTIGIVMLYDEWFKNLLSPIEIGVLLLPNATGKAYGKEALTGLLTYCFNDLALPQVNIRFHPDNKAMRSVSKKLGFLPPDNIKPVNVNDNAGIVSDNKNNDINSTGSDETISSMEKQMWVHHLCSKRWQTDLA